MAYTFSIDNDIFIGRTVPGSARLRIYHDKTKAFVAAFDPNTDTLLGKQPRGQWVERGFGADAEILKQLEPKVLVACYKRYAQLQTAKQK